jgi:hypothetical protein
MSAQGLSFDRQRRPWRWQPARQPPTTQLVPCGTDCLVGLAYRLATLKRLLLHFASWDYQLIEEELVLTVLVDVLHVEVGAAPLLGGLAIGPIDYPMLHPFHSPFSW